MKYCTHCGAQMDDAAQVCGNCGAHFGPVSRSPRKSKTKNQSKNLLIILIAAVLALVILCSVIGVCVNKYTGSNGIFRKTVSAILDEDLDAVEDFSSEYFFSFARGVFDIDDAIDNWDRILDQNLEIIEEEVGRKYKLSCNLEDSYLLEGRDFRDCIDSLEETAEYLDSDYDVDIVSKIRVYEISLIGKSKKDEESVDLIILTVKEDGHWRLLDIAEEEFW